MERRIVERRQLDQLGELVEHVVVDQRRREEAFAAVDEAMADGVDEWGRRERRHRARSPVSVDDAQLEARRTGVDDKDVAQ